MGTRSTLLTCVALPALSAALLFSAGASAEECDLFVNGGFEQGASGWRVVDLRSATRVDVDEKTKSEGRRALRIERDAKGGKGFVKQYVDLPVTKKPLRLRLRYRVDKQSDLAAKVYFYAADDAAAGGGPLQLFQSGRTKSFEKVDEELDVPAGATRIGLEISIGSGRAWIDAVELLADVEAGLPDPGFEESTPVWQTDGALELVRVARDRQRKRQGTSSLRVERTSPRLFPEVGVVGEARVAGSPHKALLTVAGAAEAGVRAHAVAQAFDATGRCLATVRTPWSREGAGAGSAFEDASAELELPAGTAIVRVALLVSGTGSAWFDDVRLEMK